MAHSVDATSQNPANALRAELDSAERRAVKPDATTIEPFLLQLDDIDRRMAALQADGMDVRAESVRWENVLRRLESRPNLIARAAGSAGGLEALRRAHPPALGFWWHADEARARRVRRTLVEVGAILAGIVALLALVYWLVTYAFPPDPETVAVMAANSAIERAIQQGDWDAALALARENAAARPGNLELALWVVLLSERAGVAPPADAAAAAQAMHQSEPLRYWLLRGETALRLDDPAPSLAASDEALRLAPDSPEARFLMGRAAMLAGDRDVALENLDRAAVLAQDANPQLSVSARMLWGQLVQQPPAAEPTSTP